jgi:hypothetical protein
MSEVADTRSEPLHELARLDPKRAAERLGRVQSARWLDAFAEHLDRVRGAEALARVLRVWDLNQSDAARLFDVSRQAVSKWLAQGVPAERVGTVADLAAATDLLVRHLKRDRIPAVVRRRAPALGGRSLLELLEAGEVRGVLEACRAMFAFGDAHA